MSTDDTTAFAMVELVPNPGQTGMAGSNTTSSEETMENNHSSALLKHDLMNTPDVCKKQQVKHIKK